MFNLHNSMCKLPLTHMLCAHAFQEWFSANVWPGIVNDFLIGQYLHPNQLNGRTLIAVPELLASVPVGFRNTM